ncbi:DoxX family protein [Pedobacter ginsengisoli]|uniref:DoxX family protein n=1 Tax=Pedobacter ginsengisoli TaxID=363852 RepID=UPI00254D9AE4|nr:DoxX family protein [Pedobacter ginsengisoli]
MKTQIINISNEKYQLAAPLILRLIIGVGFIAHGWVKLSKGAPSGFEKLLTQLEVPFPHFMAWAISIIEVLGGLFIFFGYSVVLTAIPLICIMLVAMFTIHIHYGFSSVKTIGLSPEGPLFGPPGYEINLLYIAGLISIMCTGAGAFSVDKLLKGRNR